MSGMLTEASGLAVTWGAQCLSCGSLVLKPPILMWFVNHFLHLIDVNAETRSRPPSPPPFPCPGTYTAVQDMTEF